MRRIFYTFFFLLAGCANQAQQTNISSVETTDNTAIQPVKMTSDSTITPKYVPFSRGGNKSYTVKGHHYTVIQNNKPFTQEGIASWYGGKFHGRKTANGEIYNMYAMTAAHKTLPLPSYVKVTNLNNGKTVVVRINDRGPFHANRIIDLSYAAAKKIGMLKTGTAPVRLERILKQQGTETEETAPIMANSNAFSVHYFVQVASVESLDKAKQLLRNIQQTNSSPVTIQIEEKSHQIQFGPYQTIQAALNKEMQIEGEYPAAFIVTKQKNASPL